MKWLFLLPLILIHGNKVEVNMPKWPSIPVLVAPAPSLSDFMRRSLGEAIRGVNQAAGCRIFALTKRKKADVWVVPFDEPGGLSEWQVHKRTKRIQACLIHYGAAMYPQVVVQIGEHELMHCLNFHHVVESTKDVMSPTVSAGSRISSLDGWLMRKIYCEK